MNDSEINDLISELRTDLESELSLMYKAPVTLGSGHALEVESKTCLGTISVWAAGTMDWHIFDIATSTEALLGHKEINDAEDLRSAMLAILNEIRSRDNNAPIPDSPPSSPHG